MTGWVPDGATPAAGTAGTPDTAPAPGTPVPALQRRGRQVALAARGLYRRFGGLNAVDGVDLEVRPGRVTGLIGPNGAGKSTLFSLLTGVERPDEGKVLLGHRDVTRLSPDARARLGLVQTFQVPSLFASLTVADNMLVGAENRGTWSLGRGLLGLPQPGRRQAEEKVAQILERLGLSQVRNLPAGALPTGAMRLAELARALCAEPACLLLDEPASGLDGEETERLSALLRDVAAGGVGVLLVDHDLDLMFTVADVVYAMAGGKVVAYGSPAEVQADETVRATYLDPIAGTLS